MKLKTRIIVGFGMSILVPLLLFSATLYGLGHTKFAQQTKDSSEVVYDISVGESTHSQTQVRIIAKDLLFTATVILVFTALSIGLSILAFCDLFWHDARSMIKKLMTVIQVFILCFF